MKRFVAFGIVGLLLVTTTGCSKSPEELLKQSITDMNDLSTALEKKESPEKLKAAAEKLKATLEKLDKAKLSKEEKEKLEKKYEKEMGEAFMKLFAAALSNPEGAKSIEETMKSLGNKK